MQEITRIYRALSDETRLRILNLLHEGEICVCNITDVLGIGQSKASRHLNYLKNVKLVKDRRDGVWVYYSLSQNNLNIPLLKCLKEFRKEITELSDDIAKLKKIKNLLVCNVN